MLCTIHLKNRCLFHNLTVYSRIHPDNCVPGLTDYDRYCTRFVNPVRRNLDNLSLSEPLDPWPFRCQSYPTSTVNNKVLKGIAPSAMNQEENQGRVTSLIVMH